MKNELNESLKILVENSSGLEYFDMLGEWQPDPDIQSLVIQVPCRSDFFEERLGIESSNHIIIDFNPLNVSELLPDHGNAFSRTELLAKGVFDKSSGTPWFIAASSTDASNNRLWPLDLMSSQDFTLGGEKFYGYPDKPPRVSFIQAVESALTNGNFEDVEEVRGAYVLGPQEIINKESIIVPFWTISFKGTKSMFISPENTYRGKNSIVQFWINADNGNVLSIAEFTPLIQN